MVEWVCVEGCDAECCEVIPIKDVFLEENKHLFQREVTKRFEFKGQKSTLLMTKDSKCVFLSPKNKCVVYDKRPKICRKFGEIDILACPHLDNQGKKRQ